jgi:GR25 family glycosyltransferase involved in LPS biosynthesis
VGKLDGIPRIVYINLDRATDRRQSVEDTFLKYGITNYTRFSGLVAPKSKHPKLRPPEYGCMMSHLRIIEDFYKGGEDQLIIMEDDIDLSSIDNWDFTWKELMDSLPEYEVLQLIRNRDHQDHARLKVWDWEDKSTAAYLITRKYAEKVINIYRKDPVHLQMFKDLSRNIGPVADYALYKDFNSLSISIFKQVLFPSQIAGYDFPEWFINQHEITQKFWSTKHGLEDILGHI